MEKTYRFVVATFAVEYVLAVSAGRRVTQSTVALL